MMEHVFGAGNPVKRVRAQSVDASDVATNEAKKCSWWMGGVWGKMQVKIQWFLAWSSVDSVVITNADGHVQEVNVFQLITEVPSKTREGVHLVLEMLPLLLVSGCGGNSPDAKAIINVMVMTTEVG